jgi:hypothetical protein
MTALVINRVIYPKTTTRARSQGPKHMSDRPNLALPRSDRGCAGYPLRLFRDGRMVVGGFAAFPLAPHTLLITAAKEVVYVGVDDGTAVMTANVVEA